MMAWLVASAVCVVSGKARDEVWVIGGVWMVWEGGESALCIG